MGLFDKVLGSGGDKPEEKKPGSSRAGGALVPAGTPSGNSGAMVPIGRMSVALGKASGSTALTKPSADDSASRMARYRELGEKNPVPTATA
ncbi:MAG: hypothetical protein V1821_02090, partial [bacterium]